MHTRDQSAGQNLQAAYTLQKKAFTKSCNHTQHIHTQSLDHAQHDVHAAAAKPDSGVPAFDPTARYIV